MFESASLRFSCVSYRVKTGVLTRSEKVILDEVSGEFGGGQLTGVLGLSGSGKSTLLDCLSGFKRSNVSGAFAINGQPCGVDNIRRITSYVMQDQSLHTLLTVSEIMTLALNLRDTQNLCDEEKMTKIRGVLETLGIETASDTLLSELSGGERKRLQIAIELVNDPKILFVDEATTGLDCVASTRCIEYLKKLAIEGRTVVCSIHQPSSSLLKMFDQIYALANGSCIYRGSPGKLLDFLDDLDLTCPSTYNPVDFLLEIANEGCSQLNESFVKKIENGKNSQYDSVYNDKIINSSIELSPSVAAKSSSFPCQVFYLLWRTFLITSRDRTIVTFRLFFHLILGLVFGIIYMDSGNRGEFMLNNYKYLVLSVVILVYTSYYSIFFQFLHELPMARREFFNGWYTASAYFTALMLFDVPMTLICSTTYISVTYWLTDQPRELHRFALFLAFIVLMSFASQALGVMFSSLMNLKAATTFGFMLLLPFILMSGMLILTSHAPAFFTFFFRLNFIDSALKGVLNAILGMGRVKTQCDAIYCHMVNPAKVLKEFGAEVDISRAFAVILVYIVVCQALSFVVIRMRLKNCGGFRWWE